MATYGCRCYNEKGIETGRIDGRCFMVDVIQIGLGDDYSPGSRTYSNIDPARFTLHTLVSQSVFGGTGLYQIRTAVSGNTVNWWSFMSAGIIFVMKTENAV
ncbi:hypothetical protein G3601_002497 [Salmonella enterica]|uniref:Uncharacterized protein n=4 Tax=Salmonella enterica TaxID=28901 RepID=A0A3Z6QS21_SALEB|nr:hypothetical protein [Salmonella enterica subsp. enterica serovar Java]EAN9725288.1 hypothetical protein [Salmonella enterica]EBU8673114.1 hypothetical protein [Salmonella enterica subsp. enterica serovar Panama]EBV8393227.1 hypothetical protein [Salmonella enterica subsp. enterica serovar Virchow]ECA3792265.1 hypothetical protein [Salmonella enterica subsp. enterica serovar Aqua]ECF2799898.1 hypothetical protein [Salmonella enterica subsp. enterica serovar Miami]EDD5836948.1 hypothetical 